MLGNVFHCTAIKGRSFKCIPHQTVTILFFLVKWNFVGKGEKHLSLEVGDMVYIQEVCDGKNILKHKNTIILNLT